MKKIIKWVASFLMVLVALFLVAAIMPAQAAQWFENQDVNIVSKLGPQYLGWKVHAGSTTQTVPFYYKVSANVRGVGETSASPVTTAYATYGPLSSTNSIRLMWAAVEDASEYYLYKSSSSSSTYFYLLATIVNALTTIDTGGAVGAAYSAPSPAGGNLIVENTITTKNLTVTGTLSPYSTGTFSAEGISITYGVAAATGAFSGAVNIVGAATLDSTLDVDGNVVAGAANYRSTFTAASGNLALTGSLTSLAGLSGTTGSFSSTLGVTGVTTSSGTINTGYSRHGSKTLAQLNAYAAGAAGEDFYCSDCINEAICVSSGTGRGAFVDISSPTAHCDTVNP